MRVAGAGWAMVLLVAACGGRGGPGRADAPGGKPKREAKVKAEGNAEVPVATARPFQRSVEHQVALRACAAVPCTPAEIGAIAQAVRAPSGATSGAPVCRAVSFLDDPARPDEPLRGRATVDCERPGATGEINEIEATEVPPRKLGS